MGKNAAAVVAEMEACRQIVWAVRQEIRAFWPTPNQLDSLRFAVSEGGEAVQAQTAAALALAWENTTAQQGLSLNQAYGYACQALDGYMRTQRAYARNRDKAITIADELADCALMLVTALGPGWEPGEWITDGVNDAAITLESICHYAAGALNLALQNPAGKSWRVGAELAVAAIARYLPETLQQAVGRRLGRIALKHTGRTSQALVDAPVRPTRRAKNAPQAA